MRFRPACTRATMFPTSAQRRVQQNLRRVFHPPSRTFCTALDWTLSTVYSTRSATDAALSSSSMMKTLSGYCAAIPVRRMKKGTRTAQASSRTMGPPSFGDAKTIASATDNGSAESSLPVRKTRGLVRIGKLRAEATSGGRTEGKVWRKSTTKSAQTDNHRAPALGLTLSAPVIERGRADHQADPVRRQLFHDLVEEAGVLLRADTAEVQKHPQARQRCRQLLR